MKGYLVKTCLVCEERASRALIRIERQEFPLCLIHQSFVESALDAFISNFKKRCPTPKDVLEAIELVKSYKGRYQVFEKDIELFRNRQEHVRAYVQTNKATMYK